MWVFCAHNFKKHPKIYFFQAFQDFSNLLQKLTSLEMCGATRVIFALFIEKIIVVELQFSGVFKQMLQFLQTLDILQLFGKYMILQN